MAMKEKDQSKLKEHLDQHYAWPALYMFKFISPSEKVEEVEGIFPKNEVKRKASSGGKYISITVKAMMPSSDAIIEKYTQAHKIKGVIAL